MLKAIHLATIFRSISLLSCAILREPLLATTKLELHQIKRDLEPLHLKSRLAFDFEKTKESGMKRRQIKTLFDCLNLCRFPSYSTKIERVT